MFKPSQQDLDDEMVLLNSLYACRTCTKDKKNCNNLSCKFYVDLTSKDNMKWAANVYANIVRSIHKEISLSPIFDDKTVRNDIDSAIQYGTCPVCGASINDWDDCRVCGTCGQHLDWSAENV